MAVLTWKQMNRSTKLGLVSTGVYVALTLAIPALADTGEKSVPTTAMEQVMTVKQAKCDYELKLAEYCKDDSLNSNEVEDLDKLLGQYLEVKNKKITGLERVIPEESSQTDQEVKTDSLELVIKDFEYWVLPFYPRLISQELKYDALEPVTEGIMNLRTLIERAYKLTDDYILEDLLEKEVYQIKDIVVFNERLDIHKIIKKSKEKTKEVYNPVEESVKKVDLSGAQLRFVKSSYEAYLEARDKEFASSKRYWNAGIEGVLAKDEEHIGVGKGFFDEEMMENLKDALKIQGYILGVSKFYKGVGFEAKFPQIPNWVMMLFGAGFPFIRNAILASVVKRGYDGLDVIDGMGSVFCGLFLDMVHPWIFPIRMFGMPFVMEPMRKIFNIYDT